MLQIAICDAETLLLEGRLFGIFPTTKADARHHGIGLRNVREKVEKYNGSLEIDVEGNLFTATALLFFDISSITRTR